MYIKKLSFVKSLLLSAGVLASGLAAADMTGTWNLTVVTPQGEGTPSFTLVEEAGKLTGTYNGMMGSAPVEGTVDNDTFKINYSVDAQGQSMSIEYTGTLTGDDSIEGKLNMANFMEGTFTGKKQ